MTRYLRVKDVEKYQPQSSKRLPWIKLLTELLEPTRQPWYADMPDATKAVLHHVWLMAAVHGGRIPEDWLTRERLNLKSNPKASLESFLELGLAWFENEEGIRFELSHARLARSGISGTSVALASKTESENFDQESAFAAIWADYPRRIGRKEAWRHFRATVKSTDDLTRIRAALAHYKAEIVGREQRFIQLGRTWFNQWEDWVDATHHAAQLDTLGYDRATWAHMFPSIPYGRPKCDSCGERHTADLPVDCGQRRAS